MQAATAAKRDDERPFTLDNVDPETLQRYPAPACPWPRREPAIDPTSPWHLVRLAGRDHHQSRVILMREFETYCPRLEEMRNIPMRQLTTSQRAGGFKRMRMVLVELFYGYCFVRFELSHPRWHECFKLASVGGIVCEGNLPVPVPVSLITRIRSRENVAGAIPRVTTVHELLMLGEEVRISAGPFASFNAIVQELPDVPLAELDESARLGLLVNIFGRQSLVEVEFGSIEKL